MKDLDSGSLSFLASHYLGGDGVATLDAEEVKSGGLRVGKTDYQVAQVYATLALVEAVRELTNELRR